MSGGRRRPGPNDPAGRVKKYGACPEDGKLMYGSRADAKRVMKRLYPGSDNGHMSVYKCGDFYHFGHPPRRVIQGGEWVDPFRLKGHVSRVRNAAQREPITCEACCGEVSWVAGVGYPHECEVLAEGERGEETDVR